MKYLLILLFSLSASLSAIIIEAPHFNTILNHVKPDSLILLDIDDTLLIPRQMLGNDEWFMHRMDELIKQGFPKEEALKKTINEWESIRLITNMEIVENGTDLIVEKLQDEGFTVMGFTTQGFTLATRTHQQLISNNLDLSRTSPRDEGLYFSMQDQGVLFSNGVLFTSGRHKGKTLLQFLSHINLKPSHVVFINDKESHLKEVEETLEQHSIEFTGLRYAFSDKKKSEFDWEIANYQFNHSSFNKILSDTEALLELSESQ
jgi:hypothetical protein